MELKRFKAQDDRHDRAGTYSVLLVKVGSKWAHVIFIDSAGLKLTRVPASDTRWMSDYEGYPLSRALKIYKRAAKKFGASVAVATLLKGAT